MIIERKEHSLYLKKNIKSLVWFQLYYIMFYGFLRDIVGIPRFFSYAVDLFNFIFILYVIINRRAKNRIISKGAVWIIGLFLFSTMIGLVVVSGSVILYIWGLRNDFRYYAFFISCIVLLDISDVYEIVPKLKNIYIINFFVCIIELGMGYTGDYLGGIFGTVQGCNGYLNLFLVIIASIYVSEYLEKKNGLTKVVVAIVGCFFIMAVAELKIFLIEFPIIILLSMINAQFSYRKIILIMLGVIGLSVGLSMLGHFFEESGILFFTSDAIYNYMGDRGYTNSGDLSRLNAVSQLYNRFLRNSFGTKMFGIGLGNASYSSAFSFFNSRFYKMYQALHYQWFSDAIIYIETGAIGLFFYEFFFVYIFIFSRKVKRIILKLSVDENMLDLRIVTQVSGIIALLCILNSVYNSALNMDAAYMAYFILAVPAIIMRDLVEEGEP